MCSPRKKSHEQFAPDCSQLITRPRLCVFLYRCTRIRWRLGASNRSFVKDVVWLRRRRRRPTSLSLFRWLLLPAYLTNLPIATAHTLTILIAVGSHVFTEPGITVSTFTPVHTNSATRAHCSGVCSTLAGTHVRTHIHTHTQINTCRRHVFGTWSVLYSYASKWL